MALSSCLSHPRIFFQTNLGRPVLRPQHKFSLERKPTVCHGLSSQLFGQPIPVVGATRIADRPNTERLCLQKKRSAIRSCGIVVGSQLANCAFTLGTLAVLPFYGLMVFAPKSEITKKAMGSSIPYVVLGLVYAYLLYRSWTPDTIRLIFSSKHWLPELHSIAQLFSSEMTLASAWIHLLVVDLFVARHVYHDGLKNVVETRHSVALCLLSCPVGILIHTITKELTRT